MRDEKREREKERHREKQRHRRTEVKHEKKRVGRRRKGRGNSGEDKGK